MDLLYPARENKTNYSSAPIGDKFQKESLIFVSKYLSGEQPQIFQKLIRNLREPSRIRSSDKKNVFPKVERTIKQIIKG